MEFLSFEQCFESLKNYFTLERSLDILGFVTGILYLYWEYFANPKMWFAELIMPVIMVWLFFDKGLYADCAMNMYYFVIAIYGYIVWTRHRHHISDGTSEKEKGKSSGKAITHIPTLRLFFALAAFIVLYALIAWWLITCTDSTVPWLDSLTTALSIVAMWMLAQKYVEQWLAWIVVDAVSCGLYLYKDIPWSATRYFIYTVIAVFGFFKWRKLMSCRNTDLEV